MKQTYTHLTKEKRYQLHALLEADTPQKDIATILHVHPSTISRERKRRQIRGGIYDAKVATHKAQIARGNAKWTGMKIEKYPQVRAYVIEQLMHGQSPDCIAGRMKKDGITPRICSDTIYQWLYSARGLQYSVYLCTRQTKRKTQKEYKPHMVIPERISVHQRPQEGIHAEGDTFHSPKSVLSSACIAIMVRPDDKEIVLQRASNQKPVTLTKCFKSGIQKLNPDTVTFDNGLENRDHLNIGIPTYFCDPASPRQKPHVESTIGHLRRWFFPKGTNLSVYTQEQLDHVVELFNGKYRKSLGYLSSREYRGILDGR